MKTSRGEDTIDDNIASQRVNNAQSIIPSTYCTAAFPSLQKFNRYVTQLLHNRFIKYQNIAWSHMILWAVLNNANVTEIH